MKAKVIIENGRTSIVLTPENEFEKDIIEKVDNNIHGFDIDCSIDTDCEIYDSSSRKNHNITITLIEKPSE